MLEQVMEKAWAIRQAKFLYQFMTSHKWYARGVCSWEHRQQRIALEKDRFRARMYEINCLGIY